MNPSPVVLPNDLITEVLSLLPVKSVLRFNCVSNHWKTLISDHAFVKLHLQRSTARKLLLTFITCHQRDISGGSSDSSQLDYRIVPYPIRSLLDNPSSTFFDDSYFHLNDQGCHGIVGSCNGLVLLYGYLINFSHKVRHWTRDHWFYVWNPATRKFSKKVGYFCEFGHSSAKHFTFAFGCDNSKDTYKVVVYRYDRHQLTSEVRIFSVGDDVWRNVESFPAIPHEPNYVYLGGTLNWLAIHNKDNNVKKFVIVSLDLRTETYNQYLLPPCFDEVSPRELVFGVLGGCICLSYCYKETDLIIWQMNQFGVEDSWTQFLKISYQNLQINYEYSNQFSDIWLVPWLLSDDTLVLTNRLESRAILYNWRDNRVERTNIIAGRTTNDNGSNHYLNWEYAKDYVESLVPIF